MTELHQILKAYEVNKAVQKQVALATVVQVDGSAYRRPGARMLVTEDGELTGAISGGCLEGDALRKAQSVIFQQESKLVTYDTTDEDDQKFGLGLGCNGIIHVLIEPIDYQLDINPIELLKIALSDRIPSQLITCYSIANSRKAQKGTVLLSKNGSYFGKSDNLDQRLWEKLEIELKSNLDFKNKIISYPEFEGLEVFVESILPPVRILLFGAGNDTVPLAKLADILGMEVLVIDGRASLATGNRFPTAKEVIVSKAEDALENLAFDRFTVALLMTHNFEYEAVLLEQLLPFSLPYVGILGPKKKSQKLIERLTQKGIKVNEANIYSPMGMDIGAEGAPEIALSILAEIKAVLSKKEGTFLRDKNGPIHEENQ